MSEWLFVGGAGSTGTTLLAWCLAQHSDILMSGYESAFPLQVMQMLNPAVPGCGMIRWHSEDDMEHVQVAHLLRRSREGHELMPLMDCAEAMLRGLAESVTDQRYIGDKTPRYADEWPFVRRVCPGCRMVFITRNFQATVQSWVRRGFAPTALSAAKQIYWREAMAWQCPEAYWVRLEDLQSDPTTTMTRLFEWLELDPALANWTLIKHQAWGCRPKLD